MKKIYLLPVILCITSCSSYFSRSFTEGNVYNYKTKRTIENAIVFVKSNNEYIEETKTSSNGGFSFKVKKHFKIGYDSRDLSTKFFIKKGNLISDTLSSYGGNDITKYDSIFLKPITK